MVVEGQQGGVAQPPRFRRLAYACAIRIPGLPGGASAGSADPADPADFTPRFSCSRSAELAMMCLHMNTGISQRAT